MIRLSYNCCTNLRIPSELYYKIICLIKKSRQNWKERGEFGVSALAFPFMCCWCLQALIANLGTEIHNKEPGKSYSLAFIKKIIFGALLPHYSLRQCYRKFPKGLLSREPKSWLLYSTVKWSLGDKMTISRLSSIIQHSIYSHMMWYFCREEWQRQL